MITTIAIITAMALWSIIGYLIMWSKQRRVMSWQAFYLFLLACGPLCWWEWFTYGLTTEETTL